MTAPTLTNSRTIGARATANRRHPRRAAVKGGSTLSFDLLSPAALPWRCNSAAPLHIGAAWFPATANPQKGIRPCSTGIKGLGAWNSKRASICSPWPGVEVPLAGLLALYRGSLPPRSRAANHPRAIITDAASGVPHGQDGPSAPPRGRGDLRRLTSVWTALGISRW